MGTSTLKLLVLVMFNLLRKDAVVLAQESENELHQLQYINLFASKEYPDNSGGLQSGQPASTVDEEGNESSFNGAGSDSSSFSSDWEGCDVNSYFYSFSSDCQRAIASVRAQLLAETDTSELFLLAEYLRDHPNIHPMVWYSALTIVTLERSDLRGLWKPPPVDVIPDSFINNDCLSQAKTLRSAEQCVVLDEKFGADNLVENKLWYFREDIQVNSQHWLWHITYPGNVKHDRRGELFFYFHHSMLQRYNAERLSNGMKRIVSFRLKNGFIMEEGYNPHLTQATGSFLEYDTRLPYSKMPEYITENITLNKIILYRDRVINTIDTATFVFPGGNETISSVNGSDILGDILEPARSPNDQFYGNVHANGHVMIALWNYTQGTAVRSSGVMGDTRTAMRDPIFYRWHNYIDDISNRYKTTLPSYKLSKGEHPLLWKGVHLTSIEIFPSSGPKNRPLETFWSIKNLKLTRRLDFRANTTADFRICAKHLNHEDFEYKLEAVLDGSSYAAPRNATVRIFMAPRFDEYGKRFSMPEQRNLFFVMDTFKTTLQPGKNIISRHSSESSLTMPWDQSLENLAGANVIPRNTSYCGCGWPEHLLLPKGTPTGMKFDIFAMLTNWEDDNVGEPEQSKNSCRNAPLLCGVLGGKYPDKKPMGYPFDRATYNVIEKRGQWKIIRELKDLDEYVSFVSNMATTKVTIVHDDRIRD